MVVRRHWRERTQEWRQRIIGAWSVKKVTDTHTEQRPTATTDATPVTASTLMELSKRGFYCNWLFGQTLLTFCCLAFFILMNIYFEESELLFMFDCVTVFISLLLVRFVCTNPDHRRKTGGRGIGCIRAHKRAAATTLYAYLCSWFILSHLMWTTCILWRWCFHVRYMILDASTSAMSAFRALSFYLDPTSPPTSAIAPSHTSKSATIWRDYWFVIVTPSNYISRSRIHQFLLTAWRLHLLIMVGIARRPSIK